MAQEPPTIVVGLYGVSASGKTHLMREVEQMLGTKHFTYYEGAEVISKLCPGGLDNFKNMVESDKVLWRQKAIREIQHNAAQTGKLAVVAGHYSFWDAENATIVPAVTPDDLAVYTHIIYLNTAPDTVLKQQQSDTTKQRKSLSLAQIHEWQRMEQLELRKKCNEHGIFYIGVTPSHSSPAFVSTLLTDFRIHNELHNSECAKNSLNTALSHYQDSDFILMLDADKTLAPVDIGLLLCDKLDQLPAQNTARNTFKALFDGSNYSYRAFRRATLFFEETSSNVEFDSICEEISKSVQPHSEMKRFLRDACNQQHLAIVVVTCGFRELWQNVIDKLQLPRPIHVVGGGRISDGFVVTPEVKGMLVSYLKKVHKKTVYAVGDSPLDLEMLEKADESLVVVPSEKIRSKSMEDALGDAISTRGLKARQVLLPDTVRPRLNTTVLPVTTLPEVFLSLKQTIESSTISDRVQHLTERGAAKSFMTMTRDESVSGPRLRKAHQKVGRYLALDILTDLIGQEQYPIPHVQGSSTHGYRLVDEKKTTIAALMRAGEPMAYGVNDIFPLAMFVHAKEASDIQLHHIEAQSTILLVDAVINTGATTHTFIRRIRALSQTIRIVVVAEVVQEGSILPDSLLGGALYQDTRLNLVALRLSKNKYKGTGAMDTGNRLFNTTHLV